VSAVIATGFAVLAWSAHDLATQPISPLMLTLMALAVASALAVLRIPSTSASFSISDTFSIIAALLVGPAAGAMTAAVDGLALSIVLPTARKSPQRILFNTASPAIATWVAAHLFAYLTGGQPLTPGPLGALRLLTLLTMFGAVDFAVNTGLVAFAVSLHRGIAMRQVWREHFIDLWLSYFGGVFAAMLMMVLGHFGAIEMLILIAPLPLILYVTFCHAVGRTQDHISHLGNMNKVYVAAIEALAQAVDTKDQVTHDHTRRVQANCVRLARRLSVTDDLEIQAMKAAALLHDVGKIGVPEHILNKPGRLTPSEFEIMKRHAPMGADILSRIGFPYPVVPIVRHHHENFDGTGYPDRLSGEQIPIGARILSVVDCFDALTSDRPYRKRMTDSEAFKIILDRRGNMYDPVVVDAFCAMHAEETGAPTVAAVVSGPEVRGGTDATAPAHGGAMAEASLLEMFYALGAEVTATMRAQDVGEIVWTRLAPHIPASSFVLFAYDVNGDALVPLFRSDDAVLSRHARIPLGERLSGWVAATAQTIVNSDARLDQDEDVRDRRPLRSTLAAPVVRGDRVIAVLSFYGEAEEAFGPSHRQIVEAAARSVAVVPLEVATAELASANAA
jgi:putative nucleotidyltransferase with HDIG domain